MTMDTAKILEQIPLIDSAINKAEMQVERCIHATPTSDERNLLTEANILLKLAREKVSAASALFTNQVQREKIIAK